MIFETLLAFSLHFNVGNYLPPFDLLATPSYARSFSSGTRSSSFRSPSFSSRPSTSFRPTPSTSFKPNPSTSFRSNTTHTAPKPVQPALPNSTAPSVVRITKQLPPTKPVIGSSRSMSTSSPVITAPTNSPVITRERYVERYNDSGVMGNPWFWMYMIDNNRQQQPQQPTQIVVRDSANKEVTVPENQMIVSKYSWSPIREFLVFFLGLGGGVFVRHKLIR